MSVRLKQAISVSDIATLIGAEVIGDKSVVVDNIATLQNANSSSIAFLSNKKYKKHLTSTQAGVIIISAEFRDDCPTTGLLVKDPYIAYAKLTRQLFPESNEGGSIHPTAIISDSAVVDANATIAAHVIIKENVTIAAGVSIGENSFVGKDVTIAPATKIFPNVSILDGTTIGSRCCIYPGAVIGSDGFGFANEQGEWAKVRQLGNVVLGDDVEVGANTTIDRGALEDTEIADGVKLDNLIQVAHNVKIGKHSALAACTGLAGSTIIGDYCTVGGGCGFSGHLELTDNVHITGFTMVTKSIHESGVYSAGTSATAAAKWRKNHARLHQLDEMAKKLKTVEKSVQQLHENKSE